MARLYIVVSGAAPASPTCPIPNGVNREIKYRAASFKRVVGDFQRIDFTLASRRSISESVDLGLRCALGARKCIQPKEHTQNPTSTDPNILSPRCPKVKIQSLESPTTTVRAARYLIVPVNTVRYGQSAKLAPPPLTTIYSRRPCFCPFQNLVELYVLEASENSTTSGCRESGVRPGIEDRKALQVPSS